MYFTSCFVGIPLPVSYQSEFETLLLQLADTCPTLRYVRKDTPHLTLYYLDEQSQHYLEEVAEQVKANIHILQNTDVTIDGMGLFNPDFPRVLFLNVHFPPVLKEFNTILREQLHQYYASDNNLPFNPHLTLARIPDNKVRQNFREHEHPIRHVLDSSQWQFLITEVIIYGVNANREPEYHKKLFSISV